MGSKRIGPLCLLIALGAGLALPSCKPPRPKPNVVLISIDSLRPDHLGCYGYHRDTSPTIDRVAAEGARFETAVSSTSWTLPAHAALFTGLPDSVHGCKDQNYWLDGSRRTLADNFQAAGYKTTGFFAGPFLHPYFGVAKGFQTFHDCTSYSQKTIEGLKGKRSDDLQALSAQDVTGPITVGEVANWLAANPSGPRFLFIHLWDVHFDFIPPPPYDTLFDPDYEGPVDGKGMARFIEQRPAEWTDRDIEHLKALYDGEIRWTDYNFSKLLDLFEQYGMTPENTILCITADHGEAFYEHGTFGHMQTLHDVELLIPLIFRYPPRIEPGRTIPHMARIIDIAPTLLDLAGLPPLPDAVGRSLVPLLGGDPYLHWKEEPALAELFKTEKGGLQYFAVRTSLWKEITDYPNDRKLVYDLARDPGEQRALLPEEYPVPEAQIRDAYQDALRALQEWSRGLPLLDPNNRNLPAINQMSLEMLKSLGYLK